MFGNSEASDTHIIARGPSLHMNIEQSTEFFKLKRPTEERESTMALPDGPANAFEDTDSDAASDDFSPSKGS